MKIAQKLSDLYNIGEIKDIYTAKGGHDGLNYITETQNNKYFLKQYNNFTEKRVAEVHGACKFFENAGIPVISPLIQNNGSDYFLYESNYYALFPYVIGVQKTSNNLNNKNYESMGLLLGKMHNAVGSSIPLFISSYKSRKFDFDVFNKNLLFLLNHINKVNYKSDLDYMNIKTLISKQEYVNNNKELILAATPSTDISLVHKDFHERNIFFDENDEIYKIFDFDKACADSKNIEICRTILFSCVAGKFDNIIFNNIRIFLDNYQKVATLNKKDLENALNFYIYDDMFSLWIMDQYYLKNNTRTKEFMQRQHDTQIYMSVYMNEFIRQVMSFI